MSLIGNHIEFPNYICNEVIKISGVMARDLEYSIDEVVYGSFRNYISAHTKLPVYFNTYMMWNAMDWALMNLAIQPSRCLQSKGRVETCTLWPASRTSTRRT